MTTILIRNAYSSLADTKAAAEAASMTVRAGTMRAEAVAMAGRACTLNANADEIINATLIATDAASEVMTIPFDDVEMMLNNARYMAATMRNTARQLTIEAIRLACLATEQAIGATRITEHRELINASAMFG
jgi:hypothetical protein